MNAIADALSIAFVVLLMGLALTFSLSMINQRRRHLFGMLTGILTGIAIGFMIVFIIGGLFFPEPLG
ncbi:MAG: hypothetical protein ACTSRS_16175 [Candidatus Helarchaeota archaeon]